jgi:hypothetical protein
MNRVQILWPFYIIYGTPLYEIRKIPVSAMNSGDQISRQSHIFKFMVLDTGADLHRHQHDLQTSFRAPINAILEETLDSCVPLQDLWSAQFVRRLRITDYLCF